MKRRDEYQAYLNSKEWQEIRDHALDRTSGFCQFCGEVAVYVHHVKYPKQFGEEHPNSLVPVCRRCHEISHGVQKMKEITEAERMTEIGPNGEKLNYLLSGGRVYASAKSWARALRVPDCMSSWFENGLARNARLKNPSGDRVMSYLNIEVYRWHVVSDQLRAFDRRWYGDEFRTRPRGEQEKLKEFHENYERLVDWGNDLQERALSSILNPVTASSSPITQEDLVEAIRGAVAPRLRQHDDKLHEHDCVITEIQKAVPVFRDADEFITVKQAISEQGLDATSVPLFPRSRENLSGLAGQLLKDRGAEQGPGVTARLDGQALVADMNTYRRRAIYDVLKEISRNVQPRLL